MKQGKTAHVHRLEKSTLSKYFLLPSDLQTQSNLQQYINDMLHRTKKTIWNFIWKHKRLTSSNNLVQREQS